MSIVATMMFPNEGIVMYSDKRAIRRINSKVLTTNDFVKIFKIDKRLAFGITGHAEWGLFVLQKLKENDCHTIEAMIKFIQSLPTSDLTGSTVTLAGIYDNNRPFIWTYRSVGETAFHQDYISYSIATEPQELGDSCAEFLKQRFEETNDPHLTLKELIRFASSQNPTHISDTYDYVVIPLKQ